MSEVRTKTGTVMVSVKALKKHFLMQKGAFLKKTVGTVRAVDDVSFTIQEGETLGLVGESGCGKTTLGRCLIRILEPTSGEIEYTKRDGSLVDLAQLSRREMLPFWRDIRMIFQDPQSSLNPRLTVMDIVGEALKANRVATGHDLEDRVAELLRRVGLRPEYLRRYPHAFSGGERQRIGIARALSLEPRLVIADEAVSALDVSVRAQTLNLLEDLQEDFGLTYLFVAHDLSVVQHISDRVIVMYVGKVSEIAETDDLYSNPLHPYTEALLSAVPKPDPHARNRGSRIRLKGDVADPSSPPTGCYFHPRCRYMTDHCRSVSPEVRELKPGHFVACHRAEELSLTGI